MPPHLLLQYGESQNESENAPVSYGVFRHRGEDEHIHSLGAGGCQEGTGKDDRREVCHTKDVPGGLTIKNEKGALRLQGVFSVEK